MNLIDKIKRYISINAEKAFENRISAYEKRSQETKNKNSFLNLIKGIYKLPRAKIILTDKELHAFPKLKKKNVYYHHFYLALYWKTTPGQ